jgi:cytochrome b561
MKDHDAANYDAATIALHWITAVLVVGLWVIGETGDWIPKGPGRSMYWSLHVVFGFLLVAVTLARLGWRLAAGRRLPGVGAAAMRFLAKAMHSGLYLLLALVLAFGVANALVRGFRLFDLFALPQLIAPDWKKTIAELHELGANLLILAVGAHAVAALAHHFVFRDDVLSRMRP